MYFNIEGIGATVNGISSSDPVYCMSEMCVNYYARTGNDCLFEAFVTKGPIGMFRESQEINPAIAASTSKYVKEFEQESEGKDKNWFAKAIRSLRSLYQKWLAKAKAEKDANKAGIFKRVLSTILGGIDFLLKKLEGLGTSTRKQDKMFDGSEDTLNGYKQFFADKYKEEQQSINKIKNDSTMKDFDNALKEIDKKLKNK